MSATLAVQLSSVFISQLWTLSYPGQRVWFKIRSPSRSRNVGGMGRRVIVRLENQCRLARSPPPAWHPGQVGYVCINKHLPPPPSLRPGPNRRRERDRREEEVSSERYLSLGDLLGGEGQPRGRLACQFRQQSFLPLPLSITGRGTPKGLPFAVLPARI